jgi:ankyrin repeat protein
LTALALAARFGHEKSVDILLTKGVDSNLVSSSRTPLLWAALNGHKGIMMKLLKEGVYVNVKNRNMCTPLYYAARHGHDDTVEKLLDAGADANSKGKNMKTPLSWAAWNGHSNICKIMPDAGANPKYPR